MKIILLGVLGTVISTIIGTLWYSMKSPMGKVHLESLGFTKLSPEEQKKRVEEMKPKMWKYYLLQMLLAFLTSVFIAFVLIAQKAFGLSSAVVYGELGLIGLCFTVQIVGQSLLWGNVDLKLRWKKFFSDSFANLVTYMVIVFVFSLIA